MVQKANCSGNVFLKKLITTYRHVLMLRNTLLPKDCALHGLGKRAKQATSVWAGLKAATHTCESHLIFGWVSTEPAGKSVITCRCCFPLHTVYIRGAPFPFTADFYFLPKKRCCWVLSVIRPKDVINAPQQCMVKQNLWNVEDLPIY